MAIRPADPNDAEAVSRLLNIGDCSRLIEDGAVRVLTQDSEVVGALVMSDGIDHLMVERLVVSPSPHTEAFARIMLAFAEQEARERGHDQVRIRVPEPVPLYRSLGYRHVGRVENNGVSLIVMAKIVV